MRKQQRFMDGERLKLVKYMIDNAASEPALHRAPKVRESLFEISEELRKTVLALNS